MALLSLHYKHPARIVYYNHEKLQSKCVVEIMETMLHGAPPPTFFEALKNMDQDRSTWYFVSCRADWQKGELFEHQHWVPAWHRSQMAEETFSKMKLDASASMTENLLDAASAMANCAESAAPLVKGMANSLKDVYLDIHRQHQFLQDVHAIDMVVDFVPGDGSCAVWSAMVLNAGFGTRFPDKSMYQIREVLSKMWLEHSKECMMRKLFFLAGLDFEVPLPLNPLPEMVVTPKKTKITTKSKADLQLESPEDQEKAIMPPRLQARAADFGQTKPQEPVRMRIGKKRQPTETEAKLSEEMESKRPKSTASKKSTVEIPELGEEEELSETDKARMICVCVFFFNGPCRSLL